MHLDLTTSDTRQNPRSFALQWIDFNLEFHTVLKKKKASLNEMGSQIKKPLRTTQNNSTGIERKEVFHVLTNL
jgi:hypothetical protein